MIRCPACGQENPPQMTWCHHCGGKLDLTKNELDQFLGSAIKVEKQQHTERRLRKLLAFSVFAFMLALAGFVVTRAKPSGQSDVAYPFSNPAVEEEFSEESIRGGEDPEPWKLNDRIGLSREETWDKPMLLVPSEGDDQGDDGDGDGGE